MTQAGVDLTPLTIEQLLEARKYREEQLRGELMPFYTDEGHDVYNITAPFEYEGQELVAGRTEERTDTIRSRTRFFRQNAEGLWVHDRDLPDLPLQDPFVSNIAGDWIVGGVKYPTESQGYETHIYAGKDLGNLSLLAVGPHKMKDIRLVELAGGVGVFTRPQGVKGGLGKVGFTAISHVGEITSQLLQDAPLVPGLFADGEWGGVNEAHAREDGRIDNLGHIARRGFGREYYPITFIFDPDTFEVSQLQIIADRSCFPATESKYPDTENVLFSGGIKLLGSRATLYAGISDTSAGNIPDIPNPFI